MARKGPKTVGRFAGLSNLAGDDEPAEDSELSGIVGGLAAAEASGHRVRHVEVSSLIPHPFNDPSRSEVGDGDRWDELVRGVQKHGVQVASRAVTRAAFVAARPDLASDLPDGTYVLVYGHRRRAAAIAAGVSTMPVIVDDTVMADNGDLDLMASENLGREDLSPIAEARLYARYSEGLGLTQSAIADRLGVDQATVSRRLALLLLTDDAAEALERGSLPAAAAAALSGALPFGPRRAWQRGADTEQQTAEREADQNAALALVLDRGATPTRAADLVKAERRSRNEAKAHGIEIVADAHSVLDSPVIETSLDAAGDAPTVATIDAVTGSLLVWTTAPEQAASDENQGSSATPPDTTAQSVTEAADDPDSSTQDSAIEQSAPVEDRPDHHDTSSSSIDQTAPLSDAPEVDEDSHDDAAEAEAAAQNRLDACEQAARKVPGKSRLGELLVSAVANEVDMSSARVIAQADMWPAGTGHRSDPYTVNSTIAWRRLLAGYEVAAASGVPHATYLDLLAELVSGFTPTPWDRRFMQPA